VDEVFSSHFLEHIESPDFVFGEVGRICRDGARIEFWTPYGFSNEAFLYGHLHFLTEEPWMHFCVSHRDPFLPMLKGRWLLHRIVFHVPPATAAELEAHGCDMDFAIKYLKNVVYEFGVEIEYRSDPDVPVVMPERVWCTSRYGERHPLVPGPRPEVVPEAVPAPADAPTTDDPGLLRRLARTLPPSVKDRLRPLVR
jgi:hypothetical protein